VALVSESAASAAIRYQRKTFWEGQNRWEKIHQSLQTSVWSTAQLRLNDPLKQQRENKDKVEPPRFSEVVELFKQELENDTTIKSRSKEYRLLCLQKLQTSWPELWRMRLDEITSATPLTRKAELTRRSANTRKPSP